MVLIHMIYGKKKRVYRLFFLWWYNIIIIEVFSVEDNVENKEVINNEVDKNNKKKEKNL